MALMLGQPVVRPAGVRVRPVGMSRRNGRARGAGGGSGGSAASMCIPHTGDPAAVIREGAGETVQISAASAGSALGGLTRRLGRAGGGGVWVWVGGGDGGGRGWGIGHCRHLPDGPGGATPASTSTRSMRQRSPRMHPARTAPAGRAGWLSSPSSPTATRCARRCVPPQGSLAIQRGDAAAAWGGGFPKCSCIHPRR